VREHSVPNGKNDPEAEASPHAVPDRRLAEVHGKCRIQMKTSPGPALPLSTLTIMSFQQLLVDLVDAARKTYSNFELIII
jgi:hypothetical protein